ncbi:MAG: hypothetical protein R3F17_02725 [Planctomycetota bacterium]
MAARIAARRVWALSNTKVGPGGGLPGTSLYSVQPGDDFLLVVGGAGAPSYDEFGELHLNIDLTPCSNIDDVFDDNDSCAAAVDLPTGFHAGLICKPFDPDFYLLTVPPGQLAIGYLDPFSQVSPYHHQANCAGYVALDKTGWVFDNPGTTDRIVRVEARSNASTPPPCSEYDFFYQIVPQCDFLTDANEPNDTCSLSTFLSAGLHSGLRMDFAESDFYRSIVQPGQKIEFELNALTPGMEIEMLLFDRDGACSIAYPEYFGDAFRLARSRSTATGSVLEYTHPDTAPGIYVALLVRAVRNAPLQTACTEYTLELKRLFPGGGVTVCDPMDNNSTGLPTRLDAWHGGTLGTTWQLHAWQGPVAQFGYLLVGAQASTPGVVISGGRLCLDLTAPAGVGRYNLVGSTRDSIGQFDAQGTFQNLAGNSWLHTGFNVPWDLPLPGSPTIAPGSTWFFQLWHREPGGASNFSNAVAVSF